MTELTEISNGDKPKHNYNKVYQNIKMAEEKESMNYDSLGEIKKEDEPANHRLYRK